MTTVDASTPCDLLEWDTAFFGFNIARIRGERLDEKRVKQIDHWCASNRVSCLYFLCSLDDPRTTQAAEDNGFHFVDIRMTFERHLQGQARLTQPGFENITRLVYPEDVPVLERIARDIYHDSRFYYDRRFPEPRRDELYATWIRHSCEGYAAQVIVAVQHGKPVGYVSCHLEKDKGQIGLIGVDRRLQAQGIGRALTLSAIDWFSTHAAQQISVVTQGRNYSAQRLFQRCGFFIDKMQLWYHKWYEV